MKATVALEISLASQTLTKELMNDRSQYRVLSLSPPAAFCWCFLFILMDNRINSGVYCQ